MYSAHRTSIYKNSYRPVYIYLYRGSPGSQNADDKLTLTLNTGGIGGGGGGEDSVDKPNTTQICLFKTFSCLFEKENALQPGS